MKYLVDFNKPLTRLNGQEINQGQTVAQALAEILEMSENVGKNGRKYASFAKELYEKGTLTVDNVDLDLFKAFIENNKDLRSFFVSAVFDALEAKTEV